MQKITYISDSGDGHHTDYDRLFSIIASETGLSLQQVAKATDATDACAPLFYTMFDSKPRQTFEALCCAALRSFCGRKTIGLFFRPGDCFTQGSLKHKIRKLLFTIVSHLPKVHILSLVPFDVAPHFSSVASNWIYDPQLWDLPYLGIPTPDNQGQLEALLFEKAKGRRIIIALGGQNRIKGFDYFTEIWNTSLALRESFLFVAAGKVGVQSQSFCEAFEHNGGLLINRRIDDAELFTLYSKAHAVWSCYAPDYDQSSGIHGRSVQLGLPVIVRQGSLIERLGKILPHPTLALPFNNTTEVAQSLLNWQPECVDSLTRSALVRKMQEHSLKVLAEAFNQI